MFRITAGRGFQMTFPNGYMVSVQWGPMNYCDNRCIENCLFPSETDQNSNTAEVAVIKNGALIHFEECPSEDTVAGWLTPEQVVKILHRTSQLPAD